MGAGGSGGGAAPGLSLPQQEVVSVAGRQPLSVAGMGSAAPRIIPPPSAHHETTEQVKIQLVWDKSSLHIGRIGASKHLWELSADFSAEVPCELAVHFHCREKAGGHFLQYSPADTGAPPEFTQHFEAGKHTVRLTDERAIDLKRWPLEVYWKYRKKQADVLPIVLSLCAPGFQTVVHLTLEVPPARKDGGAPQASSRHAGGEGAAAAAGAGLLTEVFGWQAQAPASELRCTLLKQKVIVGGREYVVQEVYGLADLGKDDAHDESAVGEPCVICLSEPRNTAVLPCRHLCVCEDCSRQLQVGVATRNDHCPICRGNIAGVQVFGVKK